MAATMINVQGVIDLENVLKEAGNHLVVIHFSATWAPQCKQMNDVLSELVKDTQFINVRFVVLEAEDLPELSERYTISAVPTFIFLKDKVEVDRMNGADAADLTKKVQHHSSPTAVITTPLPHPQKEDLNARLKKLIESAPVLLFMKGTQDEPKCGFSRTIVSILKENNIQFQSFDILMDEQVRQGLKAYSNWPTYPQLYANGELIGGLDIVKELVENEELKAQLSGSSLEDRLKSLIKRSPVMLFMKGNREEPRCKFSKQVIQIMLESGVEYDTFDILSDEEVRQGLKTFSNWPTFPQLYVSGDLIGGLDIMKELKESGELKDCLTKGHQ